MAKKCIYLCLCYWLIAINLAFAYAAPSVLLFASNNTQIIDIKTAHVRLTSAAQHDLQNSMIELLQKYHFEQGKFAAILGMSYLNNKQNITADNTERFSASPNQAITRERAFALAKELAITLHQESVVVFIPAQSIIGDVTVTFAEPKPNVTQTLKIIREKLPAVYSHAFSLHLTHECEKFNGVKITAIEWLGGKMDLAQISQAFPHEKISYQYGKAYLVYQDGRQEAL